MADNVVCVACGTSEKAVWVWLDVEALPSISLEGELPSFEGLLSTFIVGIKMTIAPSLRT